MELKETVEETLHTSTAALGLKRRCAAGGQRALPYSPA